jgi:hypothetical protein
MPRNAGFNDRLDAAAAAKTAMLERFRAKQHDPTLLERQAAQQAIDEARNVRRADRKAAGDAEAARQATERVAVAAERTAREAEERRLAQETAARAVALGAEQKTRRDARYAARKARR